MVLEYQRFVIPSEILDLGHDGQWLLTSQEGRPVGISSLLTEYNGPSKVDLTTDQNGI